MKIGDKVKNRRFGWIGYISVHAFVKNPNIRASEDEWWVEWTEGFYKNVDFGGQYRESELEKVDLRCIVIEPHTR